MKNGLPKKPLAARLLNNPLMLESLDAPLSNIGRRKLAEMQWLSQQSALREQVKLQPGRGLSDRLELRDRLRLTMNRQKDFENLDYAAQYAFSSSLRTLSQSNRLDREEGLGDIPASLQNLFAFD